MAYEAKDGKRFGNHEMGKHYDSTRPQASKPMPQADGGEQDMRQVVEEHGSAQEMEMHSTHADGHKHKAKHHDAHSAHDHVSKAFGEESPQHEAQESPEFEAGEHEAVSHIPGMRG